MASLSRVIVPLITFAMIAACASNARVQSDFKESLDFSQYETYNFRSVTAVENPDFPEFLGLIFSAAIEEQMLSRGYIKSDNPDILINVLVDVDDISRAPTYNRCPSYGDYYNRYISKNFGTGYGNPTFCKYTEGSISINMVDVSLNHSIWEGVSRVRIDEREKSRDFPLKSYIVGDVSVMFEDSPFRARETPHFAPVSFPISRL